MGRKALPKLNPEVDFSKHFFTSDVLEQRPELQSYFETEQPLEIEVGSGKGLFMRTAAQARTSGGPGPDQRPRTESE